MTVTSFHCLNMFNFISLCYCSSPSPTDVGPHVKMCKEHRDRRDALQGGVPLLV